MAVNIAWFLGGALVLLYLVFLRAEACRVRAEVAWLLHHVGIKPDHGLGLCTRIMAEQHVEIRLARANYLLRQLERRGLLESWEEPGPPERGGRPRVFYRWKGDHQCR